MQAVRCLTFGLVLALAVFPLSLLSREKAKPDVKIDDATFVMKASESDLAEIALGKLASQHAASSAVKNFASHMVDDHGKSSEELKSIAAKHNFGLAKEMSAHHKQAHDKLSKMQGAEFDRTYMSGQVKAHMEAVHLFKHQSQHGQNADLKGFASRTLPIIEKHLKMAQEIAGKLGDRKTER